MGSLNAYERIVESQRKEEEPEGYAKVRRGWCLGPREFRKSLLEEMADKVTIHHYGADRRESAEAKAWGILTEELKGLKWTEEDLAQERKGHENKVAIARRLREETTMTMAWIAEHTRMGSESNVRKLLSKNGKKQK